MGLESLSNALSAIGSIFGGAQGIGTAFVIAGILILLGIGLGFAVWFLVNIIKQLPKMTPSEFLKFIVFLAVSLIIVGIALP